MDTPRPLARPLPPWPGVLPLAEAAAVLGMKPDTLQKRITRRQQPNFLRGGRRQVVLLPHQWATWAQGYQPDASVRSAGARAESAPSRTDPGLAEVLQELAELRQRVAALEARPTGLLAADSPPDPEPWWRRVWAWLGTPLALGAPRAPLPQSE